MNARQKHRVPFKVRLYRIKNTGFLVFTDKLIRLFKPPKKYPGKPQKILFVRNDKIGDALVTLPALRDLKLNNPDLFIGVLCSKVNKFVFGNNDFINKIHLYDPANFNELKSALRDEKYDAIVDLLSTRRKFIKYLKKCSPFIAGSRIFCSSWLYDYYLDTNWVSEYDTVPMGFKIESLLTGCFGFEFNKRDLTLPYNKKYKTGTFQKENDILFHLGTSDIRKFDIDIEEKLLDSLHGSRVIITDGSATKRFQYYKNKHSANTNYLFKLYTSLEDIYEDVMKSRLVLCYDGGQAHFMGQFARCLVLTGSVSPLQWAPFDFSDYISYKSYQNGVVVLRSQGKMKHRAMYFPIWCLPCFNTGCNTRPCINNISTGQILEQIKEMLNNQ